MKAEEFKATLEKLQDAMHGGTDVLTSRGWSAPNEGLSEVYRELNNHWLEMEAARKCVVCHHRVRVANSSLCAGCYETVTGQSEAPTLVAVGDLATRRDLERIEKRLGEMKAEIKELTRVYVRHIGKLHDVSEPIDEHDYPVTPEEATQSPPSSGQAADAG